jgi:hypothetical protein
MGQINTGVANPIYNQTVELEIVTEGTGYDGRRTWVRTIEKYPIQHCLINTKTNQITKEWIEENYIEGWLKI